MSKEAIDERMSKCLASSPTKLRDFKVPEGIKPWHISREKSGKVWISNFLGDIVQTEDQGTQDIGYWRAQSVYSSPASGDVLVGLSDGKEAKLTRCSKAGKKILDIQKDDIGRELYKTPRYITENINGDICASDFYKHAVVVVKKSGRHRFSYTRQEPPGSLLPTGIATDSLGHILVCNARLQCNDVHLLDVDGNFLSLLITTQDGVSAPRRLCVDCNDNLYVGDMETHTCFQKCKVQIEGLRNSEWKYYELESLALRFDGLSKNLKTINTRCRSIYEKKTLEIFCKTGFEDEGISKHICTQTKGCEDPSKTCLRSSTEQIGVCICESGYIRFGNKCLKGNLKLNNTCQRNEQCSGAVGIVCQNNVCVCRPGYVPLNDSSCFFLGISEDLCTSPDECKDESKTCSLTGQFGICTCRDGFIGFGNKCLKGKLKLNETCEQNEQCSMVFGSVCQNNTCVCGGEYVSSFNESECSLPSSGGNSEASVQDQKEDTVVSVTVGSVIGGLILGIILTVLGLIIYQKIRNWKPKAEKRKCPKAAVFNNTTYKSESDADQNIPTVQRTNEKKVVNVPPFAHSVELSTKRTIQQGRKRTMPNNDVNNDVYSHLHEKEEDPDIDENYDHANGNINRAMEESNYSNLNTGRSNKESVVSASEGNDYDVQGPTSDYCALKKQ
ncbi:uncharacterized protein LOC133186924 [Saccostrea echinata]|uniref:uncharacterized protein LOC133186924 n=1 Tax=Saccostrea echinata TaxID=191078 RepID=UPI002A81A4F9|nr:uncharacterized protein LOC133186924 [Saccostrea echinata]